MIDKVMAQQEDNIEVFNDADHSNLVKSLQELRILMGIESTKNKFIFNQ